VVNRAGLVRQHRVREAEVAPKAVQVARAREGDQHHLGPTELDEAVAHGDRVLVAGQSGQMTMEDHHRRSTPLLREPPPAALIVWQVDLGGEVAPLN
jgi:hypothetical protein